MCYPVSGCYREVSASLVGLRGRAIATEEEQRWKALHTYAYVCIRVYVRALEYHTHTYVYVYVLYYVIS